MAILVDFEIEETCSRVLQVKKIIERYVKTERVSVNELSHQPQGQRYAPDEMPVSLPVKIGHNYLTRGGSDVPLDS